MGVREVVKLHAIIKWGLRKSPLRSSQANLKDNPPFQLAKLVRPLLNQLDFSKISMDEIVKYIEPYDILDSDEYASLINNNVNSFLRVDQRKKSSNDCKESKFRA